MQQTQTRSKKADNYTWGVEIECFLPKAMIRSKRIVIGRYHNGHPLPAPFPQGWTAEHDGSLSTSKTNMQSIEIVSPVLMGQAGIAQVKLVVQTIKEMGGHVNPTCGLHVHAGIASVVGSSTAETAEWIGKLLYQVAMHERALYASTGTNRREQRGYGRSIRMDHKDVADKIRKAQSPQAKTTALRQATNGARCHSLNLTNVFSSKATVEFRWAAGTLEWVKVIGHIQTCLALCERATESTKLDWTAVASERTYQSRGDGQRALDRLFYLAGWTLGRRQVGEAEVNLQGWIADLEDLKAVKKELKRLAKKYDQGGVA